jgi:hypothetical protein
MQLKPNYIQRYEKLLEFAELDEQGEARLWKFIAASSVEQRAMMVAKQKQLLREERVSKELSRSENGIAFLLLSAKFFGVRPASNDEYMALDEADKVELEEFDHIGLGTIEAERPRMSASILKRSPASKPKLAKVMKDNYHAILTLYTNGSSWKSITQMINQKFNINVTTMGLYKAFKREGNELPSPRKRKSARLNKRGSSRYSKELVNAYLERSKEAIVEKRANGLSLRKLADELSISAGVSISHQTLYLYCLKHKI